MEHIKHAILDNLKLVNNLLEDDEQLTIIQSVASKISEIFSSGGKIIIFGNGGSACDALHFAEEFTGRYRKSRKALPVIAIAEGGHLTCVGNDMGFDQVFSRGVEAFGRTGDLCIGLSTSGNSANVIKAISLANSLGLQTFCLLGKEGGKLKGLAHDEIIIPGHTSDRIQEIHMMILHIIIEMVERTCFPENYL